jgi:hypothetical protein
VEREHPQGSVPEPDLIPDFVPEELLAAYQAEAQTVVAASVTSARAVGEEGDGSGFARSLTAAAAWVSPRSRLQRAQALVAVLLGYVGLAALTGVWWSLAETQPDTTWWWITGVGAGALALATLAILGWVMLRVRRTIRRHRAWRRAATDTPR